MSHASQAMCPGCLDQTQCPQPPSPGPAGSWAQGGGGRGHEAPRAEPGRVTAPASGRKPPLTRDVDLEFAALSKGAVDDAQLASRQVHPESHEQLDVGLLLEQGAADHAVVIQHLCPPARGECQCQGRAVCHVHGRSARVTTDDQPPTPPPAGIHRGGESPQLSRPPAWSQQLLRKAEGCRPLPSPPRPHFGDLPPPGRLPAPLHGLCREREGVCTRV